MFDCVFLFDPSLKSIFAQNKSCSSSFGLQLLFWPNFKFLYQILRFGWSNASQNSVKTITVLLLCCTVRPPTPIPATGTAPATTTHRDRRRTSPSARALSVHVLWRLLVLVPFLLPRAHAEPDASRARRQRPSACSSPPRCESSRPRPPRFAPHLLHSS